jgi:prepilin-type N-terminal cleavage/methylation domain-containing protein
METVNIQKHNKPMGNKGFTLVEMSIVLVIIGLILGMVFKGKELIDGAKVKSLAAQYNKFLAATNTFYERYGYYPGDGCTSATPATVASCTNTKDGLLTTPAEQNAFWHLLINVTNIMPVSDRKSVFGSEWALAYEGVNGLLANWFYLPGGAQSDPRLSCALDKLIDDGNATSGIIRPTSNEWNITTDCWTLSTPVDIRIKILP